MPSELKTRTDSSPERLAFVDALRGICAAYVVVFHCILVPDPDLTVPAYLRPLLLNGGSGVTLFFVLSAYTMCHTMQARAGVARSAKTFYLRRFFRIAPLYYVWFAATWALNSRRQWKMPGPLETVSDLTFAFNPIPAWQEGLVAASWTLGVEMLFYLIFPFIFRFVTSTRRAAGFTAVTFLIAVGHSYLLRSLLPAGYDFEQVRHIGFGHQLPVFAIGMLAFYIDAGWRRSGRPRQRTGRWLLLGGVAAFVLLPWLPGVSRSVVTVYLMAAIYAIILLGLSGDPVSALVNRVTTSLGTISYSLYLNHPQLVIIFGALVFPKIRLGGEGSTLRLLACCGLTFAVLLPMSYVSYRLIEQPGIWLGSRIIRGRRVRTELSSQP